LGLKLEQEKLQPNFEQRLQQVKYLVWYKLFNSLMAKMRLQLHFMNWGYRREDGTQYAVPKGGEIVLGADARMQVVNGCSLQLYLHMLHDIDVKGKDVVEVSSGRGGCMACLAASGEVKSCTGIDTCAVAVQTCSEMHNNLSKVLYKQGDAMGDFGLEADILVNVEASHCYPSREIFFKNVYKALRPGGLFLFADFMSKAEMPQCIAWLESAGFHVEVQEDITAGVLRAMALTSEAKVTMIKQRFPRFMWGVMKRFAATEGSESRGDASHGWKDSVYLHLRCRRPEQ
jgi:SAM-dependent methyltransferase